MTKSIEKRAQAYALEHFPYSPAYEETLAEYKLIAEEQRAIDIDKACEYFADWMRRHNDYAQFAVDGLRKAMEE